MCVGLLAGCGSNDDAGTTTKKSALRGTYTFNDSIRTEYRRTFDDGNYLFCSVWPQTGMWDGTVFLYQIDQRLKLNSDFTYSYEYSITLGNPGDWGNLQLAMLHVNISGTFDYTVDKTNDKRFIVNLSNPTGGVEEIYGSYLFNPSSYWEWEMHEEPDYVLNLDDLSHIKDYKYDEYICGRKVVVTKAQTETDKNAVEDNVFYRYILETFAHYSTY